MKALRIHARGGAEQLFFEDAPVPTTGPQDALVRVHATGITPAELTWDASYQNADGSSRIPSIPGHEVCGVVEALGAEAEGVQVDDEVYGLTDFFRDGAAAEFVAVAASSLAPKPKSIDHAHTAAVSLSALTAWQALFAHGNLSPGEIVLIHGAAGGVGTFAIQLARWRGARVIAAASARDAGFLRELGADEVVDYYAGAFEERFREVDLVLDTIGGEIQRRSWPVLKPGGLLVALTAPIPAGEAEKHAARGNFFIVEANREQLMEISRLVDDGRLRPIVSRILPLSLGAEAFVRDTSGNRRGKTVLRVID
jgi:NADPH:quinone reductase-like Zn-dependent oxidoreductase